MKKNKNKQEFMVIHAKKEIVDELYMYCDMDILNGSLQNVAKNILDLENRLRTEHRMVINNPDMYHTFKIRVENEDGYPEIKLSGVRFETDKEFEARLEKNKKDKLSIKALRKKQKEKKEKEEHKTYLRLKEKFEKK